MRFLERRGDATDTREVQHVTQLPSVCQTISARRPSHGLAIDVTKPKLSLPSIAGMKAAHPKARAGVPIQDTRKQWARWISRTAAGVLAASIAVDLVHFALAIGRTRTVVSASRSFREYRADAVVSTREHDGDIERIVSAHLFGASAGATAFGKENVVRARGDLALSGVIATTNPRDGYAILGKRGGTAQLYRTGTALSGLGGGTLYQVFLDRVVLDLGDRYETVRLSRAWGTGGPLAIAAVQRAHEDSSASTSFETPFQPVTAAETAFGNLDAEEQFANGRFAGMVVHPAKYFQRLYGLQDGDVVTAVNGVEITSRDALAHSLKTSGDSVSLTVVHEGVEQTVSLPMSN